MKYVFFPRTYYSTLGCNQGTQRGPPLSIGSLPVSYGIFWKCLLWWVRGRLGDPKQWFRLSKPHKTKQNPVLDRHEMWVNVSGCKRLPTDFAESDSTLQIRPAKGNEGLIVMPHLKDGVNYNLYQGYQEKDICLFK